MKLASYCIEDRATFGVVDGDRVSDIGAMVGAEVSGLKEALVKGLDWIADMAKEATEYHSLDSVCFLPVIPSPEKVIGIGINTKSHFEEAREYTKLENYPDKPWLFVRPANSLVAHNDSIVIPTVSTWVDFESELAVVIGKRVRNVSAEDAMDYVAGYACFNDGSVRDYQIHTPQLTAGKIFPATGGFGPWMTTVDEAPAQEDMEVSLILNGEVMQRMTLDDLIIPIPEIIAYVSQVTELEPGDVIVTGSPEGIGALRNPPVWMKPGDEVVVDISGVGRLVNSVRDAE
jgi:2-keto-4-pentenoate hydratase/2-oxohepta-3-ene-1,7-dioic acid hydratase in catechol pathway